MAITCREAVPGRPAGVTGGEAQVSVGGKLADAPADLEQPPGTPQIPSETNDGRLVSD